MRRFVRHPTGIPIEVSAMEDSAIDVSAPEAGAAARSRAAPIRNALLDVSFGGLAFQFERAVAAGSLVCVRIPTLEPAFESTARVIWCRRSERGFRVGARFLQEQDAFRVRMVEQVCQIESYRQRVRDREHRELSADDAAREWIAKFAARFPAGRAPDSR
jgi:hypothetical protein